MGRLPTMKTDEESAMTNGPTNSWTSMTLFIVGLVSGISAGILLAPQSGARTRRQLRHLAQDFEEQTDHLIGDAKASIGKAIERGMHLIA
ncbi:MAG: hypothetical protein GDA67_00400 [Nitrospira sp. CR1.3]|nr:hypothetical protein [Nitrospira sp. CR1.3]